MTSIIKGYNYDIFISYRQKDNKHDGWVTEFAENLRGELESTFKEEISVYFDINPHDGLLETHDVNASLKEKLNCVVFIPIVSRTYCDPNSFAWKHEFKAFVENASADQFGLKIKLPNGNVASRVLPVRIHPLDDEDNKLFEAVLGGVLRGVEFIYREPGIDKPLAPGDNEKKNLNNTVYRIQIIKVAHAIREIIQGMKAGPLSMMGDKDLDAGLSKSGREDNNKFEAEKVVRSSKFRIWSAVIFLAALIAAALIYYPGIFKPDKIKALKDPEGKISIAIMPFKNLTSDTLYNIWQKGLQNLLITSLSNSGELSVRQVESMDKIFKDSEQLNYASITPSFARSAALKLQANTVIIGNIFSTGNSIHVTANLMDSRSEEIYKSFETSGRTEDDFFYITDTLSMLIKNYLAIKELKNTYGTYDLKSVFTSSAEAFKYYIQGRSYHGRLDYATAVDLYKKSISSDTNFVSPMLMLSYVYGDIGQSEESKIYAYKAFDRINNVPQEIQFQIMEVKAAIDKAPEEQIKHLKQYLEFNPYSSIKYYTLGWVYLNIDQWQEAIDAFEKGIEINKPFSSSYTLWIWHYVLLGNAYHNTGDHTREAKIYEEALVLHPSEASLVTYWQSVCSLSLGDTAKANNFLADFKAAARRKNRPEPDIVRQLASIYYHADLVVKAEELYRLANSMDPRNPVIKNDLAYLLISEDINISEGLDLISQALETDPEDWDYLFNYGLGLYKQGNYEKALEFIRKSWEMRPYYNHEVFLALKSAEKAVAGNNRN